MIRYCLKWRSFSRYFTPILSTRLYRHSSKYDNCVCWILDLERNEWNPSRNMHTMKDTDCIRYMLYVPPTQSPCTIYFFWVQGDGKPSISWMYRHKTLERTKYFHSFSFFLIEEKWWLCDKHFGLDCKSRFPVALNGTLEGNYDWLQRWKWTDCRSCKEWPTWFWCAFPFWWYVTRTRTFYSFCMVVSCFFNQK